MTPRGLIRAIVIGGLLVLLAALVLPRLLVEERKHLPAISQSYTTASQMRDSLGAAAVAADLREQRHGTGTVITGRLETAVRADAQFEIFVMDVRRLADSRQIPSLDEWAKHDPRATSFRGTAGNVASAVIVHGSDPMTANYPHAEVAALDRAVLGAFETGHAAIEPKYEFDN